MMSSSLLLLIIPSHKSNKSIITGKLFEYLATRKPILCLGPADGDAAEIIKKCGSGVTLDYHDSEKISEYIANIDRFPEISDNPATRQFSRYNLTRRMAEVLLSD
jgi:hypothetical protein